jgi:5-methylcytosine-specific restriction endonuclease McrA
MNVKYHYTIEELKTAASKASNMTEVLRLIGAKLTGGTHSHLKRRILSAGIDISHFNPYRNGTPRGFLKIAKEKILVPDRLNGRRENAEKLRRALIESGVKFECAVCSQDENWHGEKLTLEVDHIDSRFTNNALTNLRFVCPNCHSILTAKSRALSKKPKPTPAIHVYRAKSLRKPRKSRAPDEETLKEMVASKPMTTIAREFHVTDNAVRKWCVRYGIDYKAASPFAKS